MIDDLFFDTDCLSSFIIVGREDILLSVYDGHIKIPAQVNAELFCHGMVNERNVVNNLIADGKIEVVVLERKSAEAKIYRKLTQDPDIGDKKIGSGEAAAIALAYTNKGILASCNYRDVWRYIQKYNLKYTDVAETLYYAIEHHYITIDDAENVWAAM